MGLAEEMAHTRQRMTALTDALFMESVTATNRLTVGFWGRLVDFGS